MSVISLREVMKFSRDWYCFGPVKTVERWAENVLPRLNEAQLKDVFGWNATKAIRELIYKFQPSTLEKVDEYREQNPNSWDEIEETFLRVVQGLKNTEETC